MADSHPVVGGYGISPLLQKHEQGQSLSAQEQADRLDEAMVMRKKSKAVLPPLVTSI